MKIIPWIAAVFFTTIIVFTFSCDKIVPVVPPPIGGGGGGDTTVAPPPSEDSIVYTDIDPDEVVLGKYNLDLNHDDSADFIISRSLGTWTCRNGAEGPATTGYLLTIGIAVPAGENNEVMYADTSVGIADPVDSNVVIGADEHWSLQAGLELFSDHVSSCPVPFPNKVVLKWSAVTDKYLGLKFIKAGNTYYGWARVSTSTSGNLVNLMITVKDFAYNNVPGHAIRAGQKQ
jgi:hypothetical protein